jgi:hypothetical protein
LVRTRKAEWNSVLLGLGQGCRADFPNQGIDARRVLGHIALSMSLYQHELFTIDLNKVIAIHQNEDEITVTIRTDDQRKIEVGTGTPEEAVELLDDFAQQWEKAVGPLLRHERHLFLTAAIYSIQVEEAEVFIYFRDYSISFTLPDALQASELLTELSRRWQEALGAGAAR